MFRGSVVVYTGEDEAEVRKIIEKDIYATSGVWDLEKVQILPVCAMLSLTMARTEFDHHLSWF